MPRKVQLVHYNLVHMPVKVRRQHMCLWFVKFQCLQTSNSSSCSCTRSASRVHTSCIAVTAIHHHSVHVRRLLVESAVPYHTMHSVCCWRTLLKCAQLAAAMLPCCRSWQSRWTCACCCAYLAAAVPSVHNVCCVLLFLLLWPAADLG
jgi:hypothetical protein